MKQQLSILTQSKFYSPVFNGAIFDGPIRIYFAQAQESIALKVYFALLSRFKEIMPTLREYTHNNIFLMIYPSREGFEMSFPGDGGRRLLTDSLGSDHVIGVCGPITEADVDMIYLAVERHINQFAGYSEARTASMK